MSTSQTNERAPRKRGPNYTEAEKENLMFLAKRHNNIIESKATGSAIFKKKADAWGQLVKSYNASSTTGIRTAEQLKHLYENMKQNARKALATSNKADYLHKLEEEKAKAVLESLDKSDIACKKTGGGCFIPTVQNKDIKVLELIRGQVEPLPNPFDSAASYFKDDITPEKSVEVNDDDDEMVNKEDEPEEIVCEIIVDNNIKEVNEKPKDHNIKKNKFKTHRKTIKETQGKGSRSVVSANVKKGCNYKAAYFRQKFQNAILERSKGSRSVVSANVKKGCNYKAAYFRQKFQNAILERRRIYQDIRLRHKEHMLLAKKRKLEIEFIEKQK
ncbi:unnamed protein product [Euphydryas editha]|uniref:Regulatory protein zeste n=1 Tax=Euphydryas editha TaxID=104508 RepID=A0AAU9UYZ6_EUPED|nr:unnamed protein product [Euphydryas editha]